MSVHYGHDMTMPEGENYEKAVHRAERIIDIHDLAHPHNVLLARAFLVLHDRSAASSSPSETPEDREAELRLRRSLAFGWLIETRRWPVESLRLNQWRVEGDCHWYDTPLLAIEAAMSRPTEEGR